jgi:hypothetical protein
MLEIGHYIDDSRGIYEITLRALNILNSVSRRAAKKIVRKYFSGTYPSESDIRALEPEVEDELFYEICDKITEKGCAPNTVFGEDGWGFGVVPI